MRIGGGNQMAWSAMRLGKGTCIFFVIFTFLTFLQNSIALAVTPPPKETTPISAASNEGKSTWSSTVQNNVDIEFTLTAGIRTDDLDWSIAGNGVNVLSELSWTDVESYQITIANRTRLKNNIYSRGAFSYAWIQDGTVRDSDYGQDNLTAEWSRSISETTNDEAWDLSAGVGYSFFFMKDRITLSPLLGLSYHKQNLRIKNGNQTLSGVNPFVIGSNPPSVGPLSSRLNSTYLARWFGPWIGCDLSYKPKMRAPIHHGMEFRLSLEFHWADYDGEGNWNLRSDLQHPKSFEHDTNGFGIAVSSQCMISLAEHWDLTFTASQQDWSTDSGTDRKYLSGGGTSATKLNEVNWSSFSFMVGTTYQF
jgi:hypothetical protein